MGTAGAIAAISAIRSSTESARSAFVSSTTGTAPPSHDQEQVAFDTARVEVVVERGSEQGNVDVGGDHLLVRRRRRRACARTCCVAEARPESGPWARAVRGARQPSPPPPAEPPVAAAARRTRPGNTASSSPPACRRRYPSRCGMATRAGTQFCAPHGSNACANADDQPRSSSVTRVEADPYSNPVEADLRVRPTHQENTQCALS